MDELEAVAQIQEQLPRGIIKSITFQVDESQKCKQLIWLQIEQWLVALTCHIYLKYSPLCLQERRESLT